MTTKCRLAFPCIIAFLAFYSCSNSEAGANKMPGKTTASQKDDKQTTELKSALHMGGRYSFGDNVEKGPVGSVIVYPLTDSSALFYLDVCRGAPSYNLGQLWGQLSIKDNVGTYDSKIEDDDLNCVLKFEFSTENLKVTTDEKHDDCGFGHAVYADNTYKLVDKSIPKYFINGEGDTILFKDLTIGK